jgi:hypothetical protein
VKDLVRYPKAKVRIESGSDPTKIAVIIVSSFFQHFCQFCIIVEARKCSKTPPAAVGCRKIRRLWMNSSAGRRVASQEMIFPAEFRDRESLPGTRTVFFNLKFVLSLNFSLLYLVEKIFSQA